MESLALLVTIILAIAFFAGPLAYLLTKWAINNPKFIVIRRIFVLLISLMGIISSMQLIFAHIPFMPKLFACAGIGFAIAALNKEWKSFKRKN